MTDIDNLDEFLNKTKRIEELKAANNLRGELLNLQASRIAELEGLVSTMRAMHRQESERSTIAEKKVRLNADEWYIQKKRIEGLEAENAELKEQLQEAKEFLAALHMTDEDDEK